ncbi:unnamed protein product [Auanema sp. JU1783]|nr:unnamed protein product [Auanema sp. JU1783]
MSFTQSPNVWGKTSTQEPVEPIVSLVDIMSEELAHTLVEDDVRRDGEMAERLNAEANQSFTSDEEFARALQRDYDREYDLSVRMEQHKMLGIKKVSVTPDRYKPRTQQESEDEESDDDDATREAATALLYAKLDSEHLPSTTVRNEDGTWRTKHDPGISGRRNADKALNDTVNISFGDTVSQQISNRVFNDLRSFAKTDTKRQHKLKDKEEMATMETSVDGATRLTLYKWINQGIFDRVEGIIATGKESAVIHAVLSEKQHYAIKVYKTSLTEFKNRGEYVKDDFRFKNPRSVLKIWAEKEYMNLKRMNNHSLPCPEPLKLKKHLLVMSLIGTDGKAAPRLRNVEWEFTTEEERYDLYLQVQDIMCKMYKECRLVHADLSEFNLLLSEGKVFVIDVSQAMDISHPRNLHYLTRDIENVLLFFTKLGVPNLPTDAALFNLITDMSMKDDDSLLVQVEQFSRENRCVTRRIDKAKPGDRELRLYDAEAKEEGHDPAREYN